jgi:steroid 5-alpha reductase family enzyme
MIGSWAARLAVQSAFAPFPTSELPVLTSPFSLLSFCVLFAVPAGLAALNPEPSLSLVEIAAAAVWVGAFAGETTADRQRLRFAASAGPGDACRSGIWRWLPHAHAVFEMVLWTALAVFATASPWGWIAWLCPVTRLYLLTRRC